MYIFVYLCLSMRVFEIIILLHFLLPFTSSKLSQRPFYLAIKFTASFLLIVGSFKS